MSLVGTSKYNRAGFFARRSGTVLLLMVGLSGAFISSAQGDRQQFENRTEADQVLEFWKTHKAHVAIEASGFLGAFGVTLGLNYHPRWSIDFGFGGSGHFQSYGIRIKRSLMMSSALHPYLAAGLSRWHRTRGGAFNHDEVSPGFLVKDLMSEKDRRQSRIDERLIHGAVGLQYIVTGESAVEDFGLFAEAILLFDPRDLVMAPTISLGASYFF